MQKDYNNGEPERRGDERNYQRYLDRVAEMKAAITRKEADIAALQARNRQAARAVTRDDLPPGLDAFDHLATMVAVVRPDGQCLLVNSTLENMMGLSRRTLVRGSVLDWLVDPTAARSAAPGGRQRGGQRPLRRPDAALPLGVHRSGTHELPVHVIVSQMDRPEQCWWR
jgi:PAS domain-containing protein